MTELNYHRLESHIASELKALLAVLPVGAEFTVSPSASFCSALELLLPHLLCRRFPEWRTESLDAIFVAKAQKTGAVAAQFAGTCILITDQTVAPLLVDLALTPSNDSIASFRVCLGEAGGGRLGVSGPRCNSAEAKRLLATVSSRLKDIRWSYTITNDRPN
jgi:hypothetical protein